MLLALRRKQKSAKCCFSSAVEEGLLIVATGDAVGSCSFVSYSRMDVRVGEDDVGGVRAALVETMAAFAPPGTAFAWHIYTGRGGAQEGAFGRRRIDEPTEAQPSDDWHWGSCVKAASALLTAVLCDTDGRVTWDTCVDQLSPMCAAAPFGSSPIGLLLVHRSGLIEDLPEDELRALTAAVQHETPVEQRRAYVKALAAKPLESAAGVRFGYSNAGYVLLAHALETAFGVAWEQLMQVHVCAPLAMRVGFGVAPGPLIGHDEDGLPLPLHRDAGFHVPALGMHGGVAEWARLTRVFHAALKEDYAPMRLLGVSEATARKLITPASPQSAVERHAGGEPPHLYSCGWKSEWVEGDVPAIAPMQPGLLWHMGTNFSFQAVVLISAAADLSLVVACNSCSMAVRVGLREALERVLATAMQNNNSK